VTRTEEEKLYELLHLLQEQATHAHELGTLNEAERERVRYRLLRIRVLLRDLMSATVSEDESDLDTGFLMVPASVPVMLPPAIPTETGPGQTPGGEAPTEPPPPGGTSTPPPPTPGEVQKTVAFNFSANRDQLFTAWNAIANLADLAGKVNVTVRADSEAGFDRNKLQNGVLEPLKEADLIE
jgi:hypothetical protein